LGEQRSAGHKPRPGGGNTFFRGKSQLSPHFQFPQGSHCFSAGGDPQKQKKTGIKADDGKQTSGTRRGPPPVGATPLADGNFQCGWGGKNTVERQGARGSKRGPGGGGQGNMRGGLVAVAQGKKQFCQLQGEGGDRPGGQERYCVRLPGWQRTWRGCRLGEGRCGFVLFQKLKQ